MKKAVVVAFALVIVAGLFTIASRAGAAEKGKKGGSAMLIPADDVKWIDAPQFPGVKMAVVQGDASKGPHHAFVKLPAGFSAPLHHHSADHYATVLSGTVVFTVDGQDHRLPAGSYFSFTGKKTQVTPCEVGSVCVI